MKTAENTRSGGKSGKTRPNKRRKAAAPAKRRSSRRSSGGTFRDVLLLAGGGAGAAYLSHSITQWEDAPTIVREHGPLVLAVGGAVGMLKAKGPWRFLFGGILAGAAFLWLARRLAEVSVPSVGSVSQESVAEALAEVSGGAVDASASQARTAGALGYLASAGGRRTLSNGVEPALAGFGGVSPLVAAAMQQGTAIGVPNMTRSDILNMSRPLGGLTTASSAALRRGFGRLAVLGR